MNVYQHPTFRALFDAATNPWDAEAQAILRDWLEDQGGGAECVGDILYRPLSIWDIWTYRSENGSGSGAGVGSGIGSGIGRGSGSGIGNGSGIGAGVGSGNGNGNGVGRGSGSGSQIEANNNSPFEVRPMEKGKRYLIHCGDWHTYTGRVIRQVGSATYEMEFVSKISETNNGDCWHELAAGNERLRREATYIHYKTKAVIPLVIAAFEWEGLLPQEWEDTK